MHSFFTPDFFIRNRQKLRETLASDVPIVITANGVMQRSGDEPTPFYQDSNFWYLTGLNAADLALVMTKSETYIIVPKLSFVREAFDGAHDSEKYAKNSGIQMVLSETEGWKRLKSELQKTSNVATLGTPPQHLKHFGVYTLPFRRHLLVKLKRMNPKLEVQDIRLEIAKLRWIKQPEEILALQKAIDITNETLVEMVKSGSLERAKYEYELEASLTYGFRRRGANGHAFAPIVGAGKHSTTLHHMDNNGPISDGDLIVLDVGAEADHYSADITRTVSQQPITGKKAEVWKAVAEAQDYALSLLKPGLVLKDYETNIEAFIGKKLVELDVISEANHENIRRYFPHSTSHFLGLDTHDVGDYRQPLEPGMVITCEPGIYLPEVQIGVRIEDDVLITETGHKVLSGACPRELTPVK